MVPPQGLALANDAGRVALLLPGARLPGPRFAQPPITQKVVWRELADNK